MLSEDSYLLEGLQWADKTKTHQKAKLQNAPTFTRNRSHSRVCLLLVIKIKTCTYQLCKRQSADTHVLIGRKRLLADYRCISSVNVMFRRGDVRLHCLWEEIRHAVAAECSHACAYWRTSVWVSRMWSEVRTVQWPQVSHAFSHWRTPLLLQRLSPSLCTSGQRQTAYETTAPQQPGLDSTARSFRVHPVWQTVQIIHSATSWVCVKVCSHFQKFIIQMFLI